MEKKRKVLFILLLCFVFISSVFVALYVNGSTVVDMPAQVQWVSHTEYWPSKVGWNPDDKVATIVRLADYKGDAFSVDGCSVRILNPDQSEYISGSMSASGIGGNWYRYDVLPEKAGTYAQEVTCTWNSGAGTIKTSQSFHVNEALGFLRNLSVDIQGGNENLTSINGTIYATLLATNQTLLVKIDEQGANLTSLVNVVNASLSTQLEAARASLDSEMTTINATINTRIGTAETLIVTKINEANTSLSNLVTTLNNDVKSYLVSYMPYLNATMTSAFEDTQWLVANAMNQEDKAAMDVRLSSIDANLSVIEDFCSNPKTSGSRLCTDLDSIQANLSVIRAEQTQYYNNLNTVVTNTWDLLSGAITTNINTLLSDVGIIKGQTTQINSTVDAIRKDQTSRIYATVVS